MIEIVIYDIEIFPNFFCVCTHNITTDTKDQFIWASYPKDIDFNQHCNTVGDMYDRDDRIACLEYLSNKILIGYNNKAFDDPVLEKLRSARSINELYQYAQKLIKADSRWNPDTSFISIDLMTMIFNEQPKGLKMVATNLNYPKLQDLPKEYFAIIKEEEEEDILSYCHNDVGVTREVFRFVEKEINVRIDVGARYFDDPSLLVSDADSIMADKLMKHFWTSAGNSIPDRETIPKFGVVCLGDVVSKKVVFETPYLNSILDNIRSQVVDKESEFKISVELAQITHDVAKGGIHGCPKNTIIEENDEYKIIDIDASSYYPFTMVLEKIFPPQLGESFLEMLSTLIRERIEDKDAGRNIEAYTKKIIINSVSGKMGKEFHWLSTLPGMYAVTLNGQLFLLMLIEKMLMNNIWVFYSNTDGATVLVRREDERKMEEICEWWEQHTGHRLEYAYYSKCILKDVNNYIIQKTDGKLKMKGSVLNDENHLSSLKKALKHPVTATAIREYLINKTPIIDTLKSVYYGSEDGVYQFCFASKATKDFKFVKEEFKMEDFTPISEKTGKPLKTRKIVKVTDRQELQHSMRYYVGASGYRLVKERVGGDKGVVGKQAELVSGYESVIFNDFIPSTNRIEPNWEYYERKCYEVIAKFKKIDLC